MKIFNAAQIRAWDNYTIEHEPVTSIELMERASNACVKKIIKFIDRKKPIIVFAGPGNNGGDGFAIARLLVAEGRKVTVFHLLSPTLSPDCLTNRDRWIRMGGDLQDITEGTPVPELTDKHIIIDAIFGMGHTRPMSGIYAEACNKINKSGAAVVSIDLPSGIYNDRSSTDIPHITATYTLSFHVPKKCFFVPENEGAFGQIEILDIGLSQEYYDHTDAYLETTEEADIKKILRPRATFAHKGNFGQALLLAGSYGMMGAAMLAAKACLRSGPGKLFCAVPSDALNIFQSYLPEAICLPDPETRVISRLPADLVKYQSIGAGPGLGKDMKTSTMIRSLLQSGHQRLVLDADALNIIAEEKLLVSIPENSVLTPHMGEFARLFGVLDNDFEKISMAIEKAQEYHQYIILKGKYTLIATPRGKGFFNQTGNPGMAKGGSGDVLTGILTGLLAQDYSIEDACRLGVFIHGKSGDLARDLHSEHAMLASDIIDAMGEAFKDLA